MPAAGAGLRGGCQALAASSLLVLVLVPPLMASNAMSSIAVSYRRSAVWLRCSLGGGCRCRCSARRGFGPGNGCCVDRGFSRSFAGQGGLHDRGRRRLPRSWSGCRCGGFRRCLGRSSTRRLGRRRRSGAATLLPFLQPREDLLALGLCLRYLLSHFLERLVRRVLQLALETRPHRFQCVEVLLLHAFEVGRVEVRPQAQLELPAQEVREVELVDRRPLRRRQRRRGAGCKRGRESDDFRFKPGVRRLKLLTSRVWSSASFWAASASATAFDAR